MTKHKRYFIDERIGCIAVRDRKKTDPDYQGLHNNTKGVVEFWYGKMDENDTWCVCDKDICSARIICAELNSNA